MRLCRSSWGSWPHGLCIRHCGFLNRAGFARHLCRYTVCRSSAAPPGKILHPPLHASDEGLRLRCSVFSFRRPRRGAVFQLRAAPHWQRHFCAAFSRFFCEAGLSCTGLCQGLCIVFFFLRYSFSSATACSSLCQHLFSAFQHFVFCFYDMHMPAHSIATVRPFCWLR